MKANQAAWPVRTMCRVLGLSPSGYYAWVRRVPSARARRDAQLSERIKEIWSANREVYGRPRIHAELQAGGERIGAKRVGRLMRRAGIAGASRRRSTKITTREQRAARVAPDLVDRDFSAAGADQLWVADITYVRTWTGFLYVAVVLDAWSRRVVGWSMAAHLRTELVLDALNMAIWQRRPQEVVHHSDQGSQYTSIAFGARCREAGVRPSTGSVGDAYDNALCESFFATLECELLERRSFRSHAEARMAIFEFLEGFYNRRRRHSALGYQSPADFEDNQGGGGSMSAPTLAIRARHAARRRHSASIRDLRADRHPNEPHSGPLRPLRAVGGTLGHPLDRPSMALGRGGPACISPAAGLQRPVLDAVSTARRWSAPRTIRLTYWLCRHDCSLGDGVTNRRSYPSTKPGQLHDRS